MCEQSEIRDITPYERKILSRLKWHPSLFLCTPSLRNFEHMTSGYHFAMKTVAEDGNHNILPDGLNEFTAGYFGRGLSSHNCFSMISLYEPDDEKALDLFFIILDAYLVSL